MTTDPRPPLPRTVVTGGSRGIGAAVCRRLLTATPPHEVIALGRRRPPSPPAWADELGPAASRLRSDHAEATDPEEVVAAMARADDDGRGLTGLVVSAGVWEPSPLFDEHPPDLAAFRRILDVNLMGAVHAVTAFVEHARPGTGSIVLVGSTAGQRGEAGHAAYAASKAALAGLAKSWAVELAPRGLRVNVAAPGWVETDMTDAVFADAARRRDIESGIPRGRVATPDEVAGPIAFLLSDEAVHVTGTVVSINGGGVLASA